MPTKLQVSNPCAETEKLELSQLREMAFLTVEAIGRGNIKMSSELRAKYPDLARHLKLGVAAGDKALNPGNFFIIRAIHGGADQSLKWLIDNDFFDAPAADFNLSGNHSSLMREVLEAWQDVAKKNSGAGERIARVFEEAQIFTPELLTAFPKIFCEAPSSHSQSKWAKISPLAGPQNPSLPRELRK